MICVASSVHIAKRKILYTDCIYRCVCMCNNESCFGQYCLRCVVLAYLLTSLFVFTKKDSYSILLSIMVIGLASILYLFSMSVFF